MADKETESSREMMIKRLCSRHDGSDIMGEVLDDIEKETEQVSQENGHGQGSATR